MITSILSILLFLAIAGIIGLVMSLAALRERSQTLEGNLSRMKNSFQDLDEQAKLIVKTDLELNRAQEELDKRLHSLEALQKTSRLISTTLDENEIFERLDQSLLIDLGFDKAVIFIDDARHILAVKANQGYSRDYIGHILDHFSENTSLAESLRKGQSFSSGNTPKQQREGISNLFQVDNFVLAPIITQNGIIGITFFGNLSSTTPLTEGDEELITILANQIGQALENARLFEEVYKASQMLETKVQDRTRQLESALEKVQRISKMKTEFISAVSHELRTPLTSIKGYASLLMTGKLGEVPDKVKERLGKINIHSDNLVRLINDLLDITRIESGKVEMNVGRCKIAHIIDNVGDLLMPQMKEKSINWDANIDPELPEAYLDSSQIERVFINLVGNAVKFTPENGTIKVTCGLNAQERYLEITVSDSGIGIEEKDLERLFDEFYRVENRINQNVKGTGLGLPLAKKIIEAHRGQIWATSVLNEGATFHINLPYEKSADHPPEPAKVVSGEK